MRHLHTVFIVSSSLTVTTKQLGIRQVGKASDFDSDIRWFESIIPSQRSLTQWIRVPVFETGGWGFESLRAGHTMVLLV